MTDQPEALRLADDLLVMGIPADVADPAAAELRRLHAEVERLRAANEATRNAGFVEASRIHGKEIERLRAELARRTTLDPAKEMLGWTPKEPK
jgi:uncharacterized small protein (DUF1192 family)